MKRYDPKTIEPKWQQIWDETKLYEAKEDPAKEDQKAYVIDMFPYPSGTGLHVGHVRNFSISDTYALYLRQRGRNVLRTVGFDAFGLPTENYAIKTGVSPQDATTTNIENFRKQLKKLGMSYDWSREVVTTNPEYYRWTQWIFLQLYNNGLAYQKENLQWWCEHDQTVLADEQVVNGRCWRCENPVVKKSLKQWFFKITDYAEELLVGLDDLDWPEKIKAMQRNWIGKSVGAEIEFTVNGAKGVPDNTRSINVFTTRADTLGGATFLVLSPELTRQWIDDGWQAGTEVREYVEAAMKRSEIERQETDRTKTGVDAGISTKNPLTGKQMPIWVADYVLGGYGTGAIMAVPAHDERDHEFAKQFDLPIVKVIDAGGKTDDEVYTGEGKLINSGKFDGVDSAAARDKITAELGREKINYKMRDWLISRQRYWGAPIPIIHCPKCGTVPVPEDQLPVELPSVDSYAPSGDGRSALATSSDWLHVDCPKCAGKAERETDTMDGYACSSWYFLRYTDATNNEQAFNKQKADYWMPVDIYVGGDHAVAHLLYARFWNRFFYDQGLIGVQEPFKGLRYNGYILAEDGTKMSKSKGNVVDPVDLIDQGYGADSVRMYELFIGPYEQDSNWNPTGIDGCKRFLNRVFALVQDHIEAKNAGSSSAGDHRLETALATTVHKALKKVTVDTENFNFNTAIAAMMEAVNELYKLKVDLALGSQEWDNNLKLLVLMLAPYAPHLTEELWHNLGETASVHVSIWPTFDPAMVQDEIVTIVLQVNGKLRASIEVPAEATEDEISKLAQSNENIIRNLNGKELVKTIYVPGKLVNFVVK